MTCGRFAATLASMLIALPVHAAGGGNKPVREILERSGIGPPLLSRLAKVASDTATDGGPEPFTVAKVIGDLFQSNGCNDAIPPKLRAKLKKQTKWGVPKDVVNALDEAVMAEPVQTIKDTDVVAVLHFVEARIGDKTKRLKITGAATYDVFDAMRFIDLHKTNVAYSMDCSGLLNSAISVGVGLFAGSIKTAAETALKLNTSVLAARASVNSPIAMAIIPDSFTARLSASDRMSALFAILSEVRNQNIADGAVLTTWRNVPLVWTSRNGSSSFQGKVSLDGGGGGSFGVVSVNGNASASASVSRSVRFSHFDTFVLSKQEVESLETDAPKLRAMLADLVKKADVVEPVKKVDSRYEMRLDLPPSVCRLGWSIAPLSGDTVTGTAQTSHVDGSCKVVATPTAGDAIIATQKGFSLRAANPFAPATMFEIHVVLP